MAKNRNNKAVPTMIAELLIKARDLFASEHALQDPGYTHVNVSKIKTDLRLLHPQHYQAVYNPRCQHQMEAFFIDYFCKDFTAGNRIYTPEHHHYGLFQDLKSPTYRSTLTQHLPQAISRLLHASRHGLNNEESSHNLLLSPYIKHEMLAIANQAPFAQHTMFNDFSDIKAHMGHAEFLAVVCTAFLQQHCLSKNTHAVEKQLFQHGLRNAYISLCLSHTQQQDGICAFISGFMHFISLIYLHRELQLNEMPPAKGRLLEEITAFLPRFNYWLAKDWGLPEEVLKALRERFLDTGELEGLSGLMQTADHANLALMLHQENLIPLKQTRQFLQSMVLTEFNLMQQLFTTQH
ncbi:MAG: hypothetical protein HRU20_24430 [Pseudomonadales bacterium]|nr:hypothetical protein [Pseudomonadales bacterium]